MKMGRRVHHADHPEREGEIIADRAPMVVVLWDECFGPPGSGNPGFARHWPPDAPGAWRPQTLEMLGASVV